MDSQGIEKSKELCDIMSAVLSAKKAINITEIRVDHLTVLADYFLIASGRSTTAVKALANALDDELSKRGIEPRRREGLREGRWVALDYGNVIVHIFLEETRAFYQLERLWVDGLNATVIE